MSTPVRLVGFVLGLLVVFLGARGVGALSDPAIEEPPTTMAHDDGAGDSHDDAGDGGGGHATEATEATGHTPGGLQSSEQGYTLRVVSEPTAGRDRPLRFVVDGPDGHPVVEFDEVHDQPLHLIKVRRDGAGFEHVHPTLAEDGTWTARLSLAAGSSRLYADFTPTDGPALVLGTDVEVAGVYQPMAEPAVTRTAEVGDYVVTLDGDLVPGESSPVTASVSRDGEPVTDLQPYLGAHGHLVALREGDLAYLHVHPDDSRDDAAAGPDIPFRAEVPSRGRYRLFLDFKHGGVVRTADFVLEADDHEH